MNTFTRVLLSLCCALTCSLQTSAQIQLYVDSSVAGSGSGTSWAGAYKTLNEALIVANAGSAATYHISIARGTYYPTGSQSGTRRDSCYQIRHAGIRLAGGFPSGGGPRNIATNRTVLSGNIGSGGSGTDNSYHLVVVGTIGAAADTVRIDGLHLTGGFASGSTNDTINGTPVERSRGGAIVLRNLGCTVAIDSCTFWSNYAADLGGAVAIDSARILMTACAFGENTSGNGGGAVYINSTAGGSGVKLAACRFVTNYCVSGGGGAVWNTRLNATGAGTFFLNCGFTGNLAVNTPITADYGGGAVCDYSPASGPGTGARFQNCSFVNNAGTKGGALSSRNSATAVYNSFIRGCSFTGNQASVQGGAVSIYAALAGYVIDSSTFSGNRCSGDGGAIHTSGSAWPNATAYIQGCSFSADTALGRGGALCVTGSVNFSADSFRSCRAANGGAVYDVASTAKGFYHSVFSGNFASRHGGAMYLTGGNAGHDISNCLFSGNAAGLAGGAICDSATSLPFIHCTFSGNAAPTANGIHNISNAYPIFANCVIWDGTTGISSLSGSIVNMIASLSQGGATGTGSISAKPQFIAPLSASAAPTTAGDYRLLPCSPAINAGNNNQSGYLGGALDLAALPRLYGTKVDMGAFEYQNAPVPLTVTGKSRICRGDTAHFVASPAGGTWSSSDGAVAGVSPAGVVTGLGAGSGVITFTLGSNGCTQERTIQVDTLNRDVTVSGFQLTAQDTPASYQWGYCNETFVPIPGATGRRFTVPDNGRYRLLLSRGGCTDTSECISITGVGILQSPAAEAVGLYPNPASDALVVTLPMARPGILMVQDMKGRTLQQRTTSSAIVRISVAGYAPGLYLIKYVCEGRYTTLRFSVIR